MEIHRVHAMGGKGVAWAVEAVDTDATQEGPASPPL